MAMVLIIALSACSFNGEDKVIIYSNADEEAKKAIVKTLDDNGYKGKYIFQSFGTSELGGKLLTEGSQIEADIVTMSGYYIESAQQSNSMFQNLNFEYDPISDKSEFHAPLVGLEGAIIVNKEVLSENNLDVPTSLKDLSKPEYLDMISVVDIMGSSTGWLMIQAIISNYNESEAIDILKGIYKNARLHMESSGSGPIKKVRTGEVAIGFGLRHQAVADKANGLPIDYIDPIEGNYSLEESLSVVDKADKTKIMAQEMAKCIIENSRSQIQITYPLALYQDEDVSLDNKSLYPKRYSEKLTVDVLKKHQEFSELCK